MVEVIVAFNALTLIIFWCWVAVTAYGWGVLVLGFVGVLIIWYSSEALKFIASSFTSRI